MQPFDCICKQDYEGENCERERTLPSATLAVEAIIGGVVGGLLVLIVCLLAVIGSLLVWKRRGKTGIIGISEYIYIMLTTVLLLKLGGNFNPVLLNLC